MEVSTHLPSMLAETEEPLPRWQLMTRGTLLAHDLAGAGGYEAVGGAVETVTADGVVLVVLIGNGVNVRLRRHGHAEGGVEHGDLRHAGHGRLARLDAHEVGGIVQRAEREALFDGGFARIVHDAGLGETRCRREAHGGRRRRSPPSSRQRRIPCSVSFSRTASMASLWVGNGTSAS